MDETTALLMKYCTAVVIAFTVTIGSCSIHKQSMVREMVAGGADPQKAACAVYVGEFTSTEPTCAILAIKEK